MRWNEAVAGMDLHRFTSGDTARVIILCGDPRPKACRCRAGLPKPEGVRQCVPAGLREDGGAVKQSCPGLRVVAVAISPSNVAAASYYRLELLVGEASVVACVDVVRVPNPPRGPRSCRSTASALRRLAGRVKPLPQRVQPALL